MSDAADPDALHLGCGNIYKPGFVNVDMGNCRVDVEHDLNVLPYPFPDDRFGLIIANHVLEHLDKDRWVQIVAELHRISAPNAVWEFRSPYGLSDNYVTDPTHRMPLSPRSFDYFDPTRGHGKLGAIYRFSSELRVLDGRLVRGDEYGKDVYHRLLVVKPSAPPRAPPVLPTHLRADEREARVILRAALNDTTAGRKVLAFGRRFRGAN